MEVTNFEKLTAQAKDLVNRSCPTRAEKTMDWLLARADSVFPARVWNKRGLVTQPSTPSANQVACVVAGNKDGTLKDIESDARP